LPDSMTSLTALMGNHEAFLLWLLLSLTLDMKWHLSCSIGHYYTISHPSFLKHTGFMDQTTPLTTPSLCPSSKFPIKPLYSLKMLGSTSLPSYQNLSCSCHYSW
jgi:hypothetical protein